MNRGGISDSQALPTAKKVITGMVKEARQTGTQSCQCLHFLTRTSCNIVLSALILLNQRLLLLSSKKHRQQQKEKE
ncbi:hypothetical protein [Kosakonia oryziphila]|jgi:hypothetical protein|uniref:hypothetical protein n=1 Tax=Kosakonia oryziphila TaxID=1005667 RepID=UPI000B7E6A52|nr:hypothetical protein [Kosakonia oryziphila]